MSNKRHLRVDIWKCNTCGTYYTGTDKKKYYPCHIGKCQGTIVRLEKRESIPLWLKERLKKKKQVRK